MAVSHRAIVKTLGDAKGPDPSTLTTEQLDKAINNVEEKLKLQFNTIITRMDAADKAVDLVHSDFVRVPTLLDRAVENLERLLNERLTGRIEIVVERIKSLGDVTTQQFASITNTFLEKDKAVSVGLSAQKESAAAQQTANMDATTKMEQNFTRLLDQGRDLLSEFRRNTEIQINDIKSRLDKGEGKAGISDPATATALAAMAASLATLSKDANTKTGSSQGINQIIGYLFGGAALLIAIGVAVFKH